MRLKAPFPWFGGKSRAAHLVWPRLGDVKNYVEPFAGSLAILLARPHEPKVETINDKDAYLANFWRAVCAEPDHVAWWADYPVNEADLHARHRWLVADGRVRLERTMREPDFYDVQVAGWWVWGQCLWIGSGWCAAPGHRGRKNEKPADQARRPDVSFGRGINARGETPSEQAKHPHIDKGSGRGVHSEIAIKRPSVRGNGDGHGVHSDVAQKRPISTGNGRGMGVHSTAAFGRMGDTVNQHRRPQLTGAQGVTSRRFQGGGVAGGSGVHSPSLWRQLPDLSGDGSAGRGIHAPTRRQGLIEWFVSLSERLRRTRVCCGDWSRVLTPSITSYIGVTGIVLDPPYQQDLREICYSEDHDVSADVRSWALTHGDDPKLRIALCGYEGEHAMPATWECVSWKAGGGYGRTERGRANRQRERVWFSPHCLKPDNRLQFDAIETVEVPA